MSNLMTHVKITKVCGTGDAATSVSLTTFSQPRRLTSLLASGLSAQRSAAQDLWGLYLDTPV